MGIKIALAGNPNCGKTTMFNGLTGANQYVGNWPGVTVEKKEGKFKGNKDIVITDLPGIYSLSPYTPEEIVTRNYLLDEKPDAVINVVDSTNIERNLYLTTQIIETGIPVVIALNMTDILKKNGDKINTKKLSDMLGCVVVETSALKGTGTKEAVELAVKIINEKKKTGEKIKFSKEVENTLSDISKELEGTDCDNKRFYSIKLYERDNEILSKINLDKKIIEKAEEITKASELAFDDDSESIITNERYEFIGKVVKDCVSKKKVKMTTSDKIDRIVTNRFLALPIFVVVMFLVYFISVTTVGTVVTDWANDGVFGDGWHLLGIGTSDYEAAVEEYEELAAAAEETGIEFTAEEPDPANYGVWVKGIPPIVEGWLENANTPEWLNGLILDGIIGGVGAVLGFVPQMLVLFLLLSLLEDCGYMARVAFIMDRVFRRFGLSGKSFIPLLISSGCGVPGIMASKTIENEKDRRMTIMTTTFIPCGAKLPIIALIGGAIFPELWWLSPSMYFVGIIVVLISAIILKKTKMFAGEVAPFVMELPQYHIPAPKGVLMHVLERAKSFIVKAGTVIFVSCAIIWFLSSFGFTDGNFGMVEQSESMLAKIGGFIAPIFAPLGFGNWESAVAAVTGLVAKENVVGTFGTLLGVGAEFAEDDPALLEQVAALFPYGSAAVSFLLFNLLCAPCFAAIGAIRREMASAKWTWFAIGYQTLLAYAVSLMVNQFGGLITGDLSFGVATAFAIVILAVLLFLIFRPNPQKRLKKVSAENAA